MNWVLSDAQVRRLGLSSQVTSQAIKAETDTILFWNDNYGNSIEIRICEMEAKPLNRQFVNKTRVPLMHERHQRLAARE